MLSKRYANDSIARLKLNPIQQDQRKKIQGHIDSGEYMFEKFACLVCGGNGLENLSEKDRYGLYMPVAICRECGLVQASPRMTQESYNHFYNDGHRRLYVGMEKPNDAYFSGRYRAGKATFGFLSEYMKVAGMRILEVGCGSGGILKYLHDSGASVKGIDLSLEYLEYGRERYKLDLSNTDLFELPDSHEFDLVIYSDVLEHILEPKVHLAKIKGLLKENGHLYIKVPGIKNLYRPYLADFLRSLQNAHVYYYSLATLQNLMESNGFHMDYGDEEIRSLWRTSTDKASSSIKNDYADCMAYLRKLEKKGLTRQLLAIAAWGLTKVRKLTSM